VQTLTVNSAGLSLPAQLTRAWESDSGLDVATNGAGVGSWTDRLASVAVTQATTGSKPTNATGTLNGLNVLTFNGSQSLSATVASIGLTSSDLTVYLLARATTIDATYRSPLECLDSTAHTGFIYQVPATSNISASDGTGSGFEAILNNAITANTWFLVCLVLNHASGSGTAGYFNGTASGTGATPYVVNTTQPFLVGGGVFDAGFKGQIAAIYASTGHLDSGTERTNVKTYVNSKWGTAF